MGFLISTHSGSQSLACIQKGLSPAVELYLPPHWGIICSTETQSLLNASHWLLRNSSFLWTSSSHITNPAILHLSYVLRLQLRPESLVYKQFYQPEFL